MDELEISGKRYISTKRAGKDHKYHADYIGQLIRANKVAGQKVGRAWYVDADSLATYLGTELVPREPQAQVGRIIEKTETEKLEVETQVLEPEPLVLEKAPMTKIKEEPMAEEVTSHIPVKVEPIFYRTTKEAREARGGLRYIVDEGPLLPQIKKDIVQHAPAPQRETLHREVEVPITMTTIEQPLERVAPIRVHQEKEFVIAPVITKRTQSKKSSLGLWVARTGVVLVLGAAVFGVVAFASTHLIFTQTLDGAQTASVGYTLK